MKIWMSGEVEVDVAEEYRTVRQSVEKQINSQLGYLSLETDSEKWAFIAIIRKTYSPIYKEVVRKDSRKGVLEFRLIIDHARFLESAIAGKQMLVIDALREAVAKMEILGVSDADRAQLNRVLDLVS